MISDVPRCLPSRRGFLLAFLNGQMCGDAHGVAALQAMYRHPDAREILQTFGN